MKIAIDSAEQMGLDTPALNLAKELYEELASQGEELAGHRHCLNIILRSSKSRQPVDRLPAFV
jgi:3-hydroxyisobutyrate dehydrogenase-like beta-hydroxyacid dehydrogenase